MPGVTGFLMGSLKTRRIAGGLSVTSLAKRANVSDQTIIILENGGNCDPAVAQRIQDALATTVSVTSSSIANPSVITTATNRFVSGDTVTIAGHTGSTPAVDGERVATVTAPTTFTVPINVTVGGTGGTAAFSPTSVGRVSLR